MCRCVYLCRQIRGVFLWRWETAGGKATGGIFPASSTWLLYIQTPSFSPPAYLLGFFVVAVVDSAPVLQSCFGLPEAAVGDGKRLAPQFWDKGAQIHVCKSKIVSVFRTGGKKRNRTLGQRRGKCLAQILGVAILIRGSRKVTYRGSSAKHYRQIELVLSVFSRIISENSSMSANCGKHNGASRVYFKTIIIGQFMLQRSADIQ